MPTRRSTPADAPPSCDTPGRYAERASDVRSQLKTAGRSNRLLEDEVPVERDLAALAARLRHPRAVLVEPPNLPLHVDAPHLAGLWRCA